MNLILIKIQVNHVAARNFPYLLIVARDFYGLWIVVIDQNRNFRSLNAAARYDERCYLDRICVEDLNCLCLRRGLRGREVGHKQANENKICRSPRGSVSR
jgi:hypothetical protein